MEHREHDDSGAGQSRDALPERVRMLENLVANLEGMLFRCRIDARWSMLFVSAGCARLTGHDAATLLADDGISYEDITHPDDREPVRQRLMEAVREGRGYRIEYRITRADGAVRWVMEQGRPAVDENGGQVLEAFVEDITEQVQAQAALALAEARYRSIFEGSSEGIFQTTAEGRYLSANPALAAIYGYETAEELVNGLQDIGNQLYVNPERRAMFRKLMAECGAVQHFESQIRRRDGRVIWIAENARSVFGPDGSFLYYEGTVRDITDSKHYQHQLEYHASHDQLTGLPNRNLLNDRLVQAIHHAHRNSYYAVVVFIDLDNFKFINDSLGHMAGDALLIEVAGRLRGVLRETDTVARYGGDEFVLLLNDHYQVGTVTRVLERILVEIRQPVTIAGQELSVSCSLGVSQYPVDGSEPDTLLRHADAAMYLAKGHGKNTFRFYTTRLNTLATERVKLESGLRRALERDEIQVHFQPKVDRDGKCVGLEALARWHSAEFGWVPPDKFIPIAEDSGLIDPITEHLLREACARMAALRSATGPLHLAVNLSPHSFRQRNLAGLIARVLDETGFPAGLLELEITESAMVGDIEQCIATLHELKGLGLRIAIDDFGTGYSSLSYLRRFPVDILKIDKSFVADLRDGGDDAPIASAIVMLGRGLRMQVVAEGVETAEQFAALASLGCQEFQGFYFARPMPLETCLDEALAASLRERARAKP